MTALALDAEVVQLDEAEGREITSRIRTWVRACPIDDVKAAYFGRIWLALGYESWTEWCDCELNGFKLPAVERREVVADLLGSGMSNRATAKVIGVDERTVRRDAPAANAAPVTGRDGKTYNRKRPATQTPPDQPLARGSADAVAATPMPFSRAFRDARKSLNALKAASGSYAEARQVEGLLLNYSAGFRRLRVSLANGEQ